MKKAKRILALILALIMSLSAASISSYAGWVDYTTPQTSVTEKYTFNVQQGASYLLDLLDGLLADAHIYYTWSDLGLSSALITIIGWFTDLEAIDLTSIDRTVATVYDLIDAVDSGVLSRVSDLFGILGDITKLKKDYLDKGRTRTAANTNDLQIMYMLFDWLWANKSNALIPIITGSFDFGSVLSDKLPAILKNLSGGLKDLVYTNLIDSSSASSNGATLDAMVQQLVNWLFIDGTGETAETGAYSIVGQNYKPLFPSMADMPGGASINNISVYQLINNLINAAMTDLLVPKVSELLLGLFNIETSPEFPNGNPSELTSNTTLILVLGLIEDLAVSNGAGEPVYDETKWDINTPIGKINAVLEWFFTGGGLDTFLYFDNTGFHFTDNFMSLLGDIARLGVNLLPGLVDGFEKVGSGYAAEDLNETYYYQPSTGNFVRIGSVAPDSTGELVDTFITYETNPAAIQHGLGTVVIGGVTYYTQDGHYILWQDMSGSEPVYKYIVNDNVLENTLPHIIDNQTVPCRPALVRGNYFITNSQVYAYLVKMLLNNLIDGCYFPDEADTIASVGAYALAGIAANIVPQYNFIEQLDANYPSLCINGVYTSAVDGTIVTPLHFTDDVTASYGRNYSYTVSKPTAALKIGSTIGAFYLSGILDTNFTLDTNFETFLGELLVWGAERYMPLLTGQFSTGTDNVKTYSGGTLSGAFNNYAASHDVYTLIDNTLLKLIPASWLPTHINSFFELIYSWLLDSVMNLDLVNLISLFQINTDANAELNEDLVTVLIRVIDRVLAIVFRGTPMLPAYNRGWTASTSDPLGNIYANNTTVTTLDQIITVPGSDPNSSPFPMLVSQLLDVLHDQSGIMTPLLTTLLPLLLSMDYQKPARTAIVGSNPSLTIEDLEDYCDSLNHANSIYDAETDTYTPIDWIAATATSSPSNASEYQVFNKLTGENEGRDVFSNFGYASYNSATAQTRRGDYSTDSYVYFEAEDFPGALYRYNNANNIEEDAAEFISSYRGYSEQTLAANSADWTRFFVLNRLYAAGLGDAPAVPSAPYPYNTNGAALNVSHVLPPKGGVATTATIQGNRYNASNYENLQLAVDYSSDPLNRIEVEGADLNAIVRLALNKTATQFSGDDLSVLTAAEITTLTNFLAGNFTGFTIVQEDGAYHVYRAPFAFITASTATGDAASATPVTSKPNEDTSSDATKRTYAIRKAIYEGYIEYTTALDENKAKLINLYDEISYRRELAENTGVRRTLVDITQLQWAIRKYESAYKTTDGRNVKLVGISNNEFVYSKIYTSGSYKRFQTAYDFAKDLVENKFSEDLTQSIVTKARAELMKAYNALVLFTGDADYINLQNEVNKALGIVADVTSWSPSFNEDYGYTAESYAFFQQVLTASQNTLNDAIGKVLSCEDQDVVDDATTNLSSAINMLTFKAAADLIEKAGSILKIWKEEVVAGQSRTGFIYGFEEGIGLTNTDGVQVVGLLTDGTATNSVTANQSTYGTGTGAYIIGRRDGRQQFRYYGILFGDVNGDARIDGTDKTAIQYRLVTDKLDTFTNYQLEAADANHDAIVDAADVALIQARVDQPTNNAVISQEYSSIDEVA